MKKSPEQIVLTVALGAVAGRRLWWLYRLGRTGQPAPERVQALREHPAAGAETQVTQVIGQRKLLQWTVPGVAHALTFWGFIILIFTGFQTLEFAGGEKSGPYFHFAGSSVP